MTNERTLAVVPNGGGARQEPTAIDPNVLNRLIGENTISGLTATQKTQFLLAYHERHGLEPLSGAVRIISFRGAETLYITGQGCAQLRQRHDISLEILASEQRGDDWYVHVRASTQSGRRDEDIGLISLLDQRSGQELKGEARNIIVKKAITQAKNRVTKSLCGLTGVLDDSELAADREEQRVTVQPTAPPRRPALGAPSGGGRQLAQQAAVAAMATADPAPKPAAPTGDAAATPAQVRAIYAIARTKHGIGETEMAEACEAQYGRRPDALTKREASELVSAMQSADWQPPTSTPAPTPPADNLDALHRTADDALFAEVDDDPFESA